MYSSVFLTERCVAGRTVSEHPTTCLEMDCPTWTVEPTQPASSTLLSQQTFVMTCLALEYKVCKKGQCAIHDAKPCQFVILLTSLVHRQAEYKTSPNFVKASKGRPNHTPGHKWKNLGNVKIV
eukprot:1160623-Pelagomonas_calceolata.AAC.4